MTSSGSHIVKANLGPGVQGSTEPAITQIMSARREYDNVHSGLEVQQLGRANMGDDTPISDVRGGKVAAPGASTAGLRAAGNFNDGQNYHHHSHHTPDGAAISKRASEFVHDGTTYATGASGDSYLDDDADVRPGLVTRIKEATPGTREHKQKIEHEGDTAVYM